MSAKLTCHHHEEPYCQPYNTYSWEGKITDKLIIDRAFLHDKYFTEIPWKLIEIKCDPVSNKVTFVRADAWLGAFAFLSIAKEKIVAVWLWFKYRMVATLEIWGLKKVKGYRL